MNVDKVAYAYEYVISNLKLNIHIMYISWRSLNVRLTMQTQNTSWNISSIKNGNFFISNPNRTTKENETMQWQEKACITFTADDLWYCWESEVYKAAKLSISSDE